MSSAAPAGGERRWLALAFIALAQLMIALDATIVSVALPTVQRALGSTDAQRDVDFASRDAGPVRRGALWVPPRARGGREGEAACISRTRIVSSTSLRYRRRRSAGRQRSGRAMVRRTPCARPLRS
jgi:hypothetical protein